MAFTNDTPTYHTQELETPYLKAQQVWDSRLGLSHAQTRQWRWIAFCLLILCGVLATALTIVASQQKNTVYVDEIAQGGRVINVAPLTIPYSPEQAQVEYFLSQFVSLIRTLPLDPVVAKQNWLKAYAYLSPRGSTLLNGLMGQDNPLQLLGKQTVSIEVTTVNPLSSNTYNINWTETAVGVNGQVLSKKLYAGVFSVSIHAPQTQSQILSNPLGIYIDNVHWSIEN